MYAHHEGHITLFLLNVLCWKMCGFFAAVAPFPVPGDAREECREEEETRKAGKNFLLPFLCAFSTTERIPLSLFNPLSASGLVFFSSMLTLFKQ